MAGNFYSVTNNVAVEVKSSKKIEKGLKRILILVCIILSVELIWLFIISPSFPFTAIEIHSFAEIDRKTALIMAGIDESSSYISTNITDVQKSLMENPLIETARVSKRFPDKLSIYLVKRSAIAVSLVNFSGKLLPVYIDKFGVFFDFARNKELSSDIGARLPVISGYEFINPRLGMRLPQALTPLLESIDRILRDSPELLSAVSEIVIEANTWDGYDIVFYPAHSSIRLRLDDNITGDMLRYVILMLDVFETYSPKPQEIDFRTSMGSYKIKEPSIW
jgi:cell division protein FtsQ